MSSNSYLIAVGKKDEERLSILNELFGETSRNLLLKAGLVSLESVVLSFLYEAVLVYLICFSIRAFYAAMPEFYF